MHTCAASRTSCVRFSLVTVSAMTLKAGRKRSSDAVPATFPLRRRENESESPDGPDMVVPSGPAATRVGSPELPRSDLTRHISRQIRSSCYANVAIKCLATPRTQSFTCWLIRLGEVAVFGAGRYHPLALYYTTIVTNHVAFSCVRYNVFRTA
jgi:hypothetical protein